MTPDAVCGSACSADPPGCAAATLAEAPAPLAADRAALLARAASSSPPRRIMAIPRAPSPVTDGLAGRGGGVGACGPSGDHDPRSTGHDRRAVLMLTTLANVVATRQAVSRSGNPPRRLAARLRPWGDTPGVRARLDDVELRLLAQLPSRLSVDQIAGDLRIPAREAEHPDPLRVPELGVRRRCGGVRARIAAPRSASSPRGAHDVPAVRSASRVAQRPDETGGHRLRPADMRRGRVSPVPVEERIAVFDNDGTCGCEKPRTPSNAPLPTDGPLPSRTTGQPPSDDPHRPSPGGRCGSPHRSGPPGPSSPRIRPRGKDAPVGWAGASSSSAR